MLIQRFDKPIVHTIGQLPITIFRNMFGLFSRKKSERINKYLSKNAQLLDVRSSSEFNASSLPGSLNVPVQSIDSRMSEIDKTRPVVVYCAMGGRSTIAAAKLKSKGYKVVDAGGIKTVSKHLKK